MTNESASRIVILHRMANDSREQIAFLLSEINRELDEMVRLVNLIKKILQVGE